MTRAPGKPYFGCDQEFFPEGHVKTNFLCNLGYGDPSKLHPRLPRLPFAEACSLLIDRLTADPGIIRNRMKI